MANADAFNAALRAFTMFNAYVQAVGQEIGMDQARGLVSKTFENMGVQQARMMKEQSGIEQFDAKTAFSLLSNVPKTIGIQMELVEDTPQKVVAKSGKCPIYEAAQAMGIDHAAIEQMCRNGPGRFMDTAAKQLNPGLSYRLRKFKSGPDDFCEEEMVLE